MILGIFVMDCIDHAYTDCMDKFTGLWGLILYIHNIGRNADELIVND